MVKTRILVGVVAMSALAAACSGGGSEQKAETKTAEATPTAAAPAATPAAPAAAPAAAAPAGAPAATDVTTLDGTVLASFTGTAAAGKLVFAQCRTCHVTDAGVNKTGPSLAGVIGRTAGTVAGFNYSAANKGSGVVWTKEKLFQYLEKPQRVIPKTKMIFAGLPDAQKRADLIAYLETPS
jgi:cytochrome c